MVLYILDSQFEALEVIDNYKSLIWSERYNEAGDFEIHLPIGLSVPSAFSIGNYIWRIDSNYMMIIEDVEIKTDIDSGDSLILTGRSLESILERRVVWNQTIFENILFQDAIKKLLDENVIVPSVTDRSITNFIFSESKDERLSEIFVNKQYIGDNLYDVISSLCKEFDIGWRIFLDDYKNFVFSLYLGVDRSFEQEDIPWVIFSPKFDSLSNSNYIRSERNFKNVARILGEEKKDDKKPYLVEIGSASGLNRKEIYVDASSESRTIYPEGETPEGEPLPSYDLDDETYSKILKEKGNEELSKTLITTSFDGNVEPTKQFVYGVDYFIGDLVQVANAYGIDDICRITEVIRSHDDSEDTLIPTFSFKSKSDNE